MGLFRRAFENSSSTGLLTQGFLLQRRRKVFKTGSAIAERFMFKGAFLGKLCNKSVQKWWCHGTTGTTACDDPEEVHFYTSTDHTFTGSVGS